MRVDGPGDLARRGDGAGQCAGLRTAVLLELGRAEALTNGPAAAEHPAEAYADSSIIDETA